MNVLTTQILSKVYDRANLFDKLQFGYKKEGWTPIANSLFNFIYANYSEFPELNSSMLENSAPFLSVKLKEYLGSVESISDQDKALLVFEGKLRECDERIADLKKRIEGEADFNDFSYKYKNVYAKEKREIMREYAPKKEEKLFLINLSNLPLESKMFLEELGELSLGEFLYFMLCRNISEAMNGEEASVVVNDYRKTLALTLEAHRELERNKEKWGEYSNFLPFLQVKLFSSEKYWNMTMREQSIAVMSIQKYPSWVQHPELVYRLLEKFSIEEVLELALQIKTINTLKVNYFNVEIFLDNFNVLPLEWLESIAGRS